MLELYRSAKYSSFESLLLMLIILSCVQLSYAQNGTIEATEGVIVGNNTGVVEGTIRWTGTDFEGYNGSTWKSLTNGSGSLWTLNGNGDEIYYDADKIGIGKTDPNKTLDIFGQTRIQSGADGANYQLEVVENGFGRGGIQFRNSSNSIDYWALGAGLEDNNENKIGWYRNGEEKVVYHNSIANDVDGGMKIGTGSPVEKLDVDGAIVIGNSSNANEGTIRWTGTDFEGYDGNNWVSLTTTSGGTMQTKAIAAQAIVFNTGANGYAVRQNFSAYGAAFSDAGYLALDFPVGTVIHQIRPMIYDKSSVSRIEMTLNSNTSWDGATTPLNSTHGFSKYSATTNTFKYYDVMTSDKIVNSGDAMFIKFRPVFENGTNPHGWSNDIQIIKVEIDYTLP